VSSAALVFRLGNAGILLRIPKNRTEIHFGKSKEGATLGGLGIFRQVCTDARIWRDYGALLRTVRQRLSSRFAKFVFHSL